MDGSIAQRGDGIFAWAIVERFEHDYPLQSVLQTMAGVILFHEGPDATEPLVEVRDGPCFVYSGLWTNARGGLPTLGKIVLEGAKEGEQELDSLPNYYGYGTPLPVTASSGWSEGDLMTIAAQGDALPGFTESGRVPKAPLFTTFDLTTAERDGVTLHRDRPFPLAWVPQSGEIQALIVQFREGDLEAVKGLRCVFPGEAGAGTIPAALVARLLPANGIAKTNFYFEGLTRVNEKIEGMNLEFAVFNGTLVTLEVE